MNCDGIYKESSGKLNRVSWNAYGNPERVQRNQINKLWEPQGNPKGILEKPKIPFWPPWGTLMESDGKPLKSIRESWSDPTGFIEKSWVELVEHMLCNDASSTTQYSSVFSMGPPHIKHHQVISETLSCHSQMVILSTKSGSTSPDIFFWKNLLTPPPHMICKLDDTTNRHSTTT